MAYADRLKPMKLLNILRKGCQVNISSLNCTYINCPSASTPKDGPPAGGAICLTILSLLTNRPLLQTVAMTGEIDLKGNITAIGGLGAKLVGAKLAGVTVAIIPKENLPQLQQLREQNLSPEGNDFSVKMIDSVHEAIPFVFC